MLTPNSACLLDPASPPILVVTVDTEAEFDWSAPYSRARTGVGSVARQHLAQAILARYGIAPTYLVDSAVAADDRAVDELRELTAGGAADIGAHLNPWLAPPFRESLSEANSYAGNLPADLERAKLAALTERIAERFAVRPRVYRAGRFGIGPRTPEFLRALGYEVDMSVAPHADFSAAGGPDFRTLDANPFWIGTDGELLEIPVSWGYAGLVAGRGRALHRLADRPLGSALHLPGILARLGLIEFVRLTPEGESFAALRRLTETLLRGGTRVFSLSYHSPSLVPGNTPYVRDDADLARFLDTLERYCAYFFGALNGIATTPLALRRHVLAGAAAAAVPADQAAPRSR